MARVLLSDDDVVTLQTLEVVLKADGHSVTLARTAALAVELARTEPFDLILLDLKLGDRTAPEVIRALRQLDITTPCIVFTGYASLDSAVEAFKAGAVDYLQKPVLDHELTRAIRNAIRVRPQVHPADASVRVDGVTRWALAVVSIIDARHDPRTIAEWSQLRGVAPETLRGWCRTAGLSPKRSQDLGRLLRAVHLARASGGTVDRYLDVADRRTLQRLHRLSGPTVSLRNTTLAEAIDHQTFITDAIALAELKRVVRELEFEPSDSGG